MPPLRRGRDLEAPYPGTFVGSVTIYAAGSIPCARSARPRHLPCLTPGDRGIPYPALLFAFGAIFPARAATILTDFPNGTADNLPPVPYRHPPDPLRPWGRA
jgi:hypothetical protein